MEVAMNHTAASLAPAARPMVPAAVSRRPNGPRSLLAIWEDRIRFRRDLEQLSRESPHLIDDIGLTRPQVEAEIAKRFWQA
jgi:uncharacterized protein YjiS (DUF1127 family)